jgi:reactive intermediate/imine deaminase
VTHGGLDQAISHLWVVAVDSRAQAEAPPIPKSTQTSIRVGEAPQSYAPTSDTLVIMQEDTTTMTAPVFHMLVSAPTPVAPFSHAVEVDGWIFVTGQMPTDPDDDARSLPDGVEAQTRRVMDNLMLVLQGVGLGLERVVVVRAFLTHFQEDYETMNAIYASYFPADRRPARTCIGVTGLARNARVEIDMVVRRP